VLVTPRKIDQRDRLTRVIVEYVIESNNLILLIVVLEFY
jgi:hypothetical protein